MSRPKPGVGGMAAALAESTPSSRSDAASGEPTSQPVLLPTSLSTSLPTAESLRALGQRLVAPDLIVFPVRHHSPACAWQLQQLMRTRPPSVVLVEGPRSFDALVPLLVHPQARMPLAIYSYAVEQPPADAARSAATPSTATEAVTSPASAPSTDPFAPPAEPSARRHAAYYPFCDHSPELIALREASAMGIEARFIDLDHAEQALIDADADADADAGADQAAPTPERGDATSLLDERHFGRSRHLQLLAQRLGCRDHDALWEHLFELSATRLSVEAHVAQVAGYCQLARMDYDDAALRADGTLAREAEMAWHVRQALAARPAQAGPVLVVVGGFHAVMLPELVRGPAQQAPARPAISRARISDESSALIRYSFDRLDRLNGYASGMTSPAWHQALWERLQRHGKAARRSDATAPLGNASVQALATEVRVRQDVALDLLMTLAEDLRDRHRQLVPMPAVRAAYEQLLQLAQLRGRPAPIRDDWMDAVASCFVKGDIDTDGALVMAVAQRLLGGQAVGQVPPGAGRPPLVRDFEFRARRQRLKIDDGARRRVALDLYRRPEHRVTSRLLHGLALLGIPFAIRVAGPDFVTGSGLDRLQEHWEYAYSALSEGALVEASVEGVTVPLAVAHRFAARIDRYQEAGEARDARTGTTLMVQACVLGLHDHLPRLVPMLRQAIAGDPSFDSVARAASALGLLWESREPLQARLVPELLPLLRMAFERATYLAQDLPALKDDGAGTLTALSQLRELLISQAGESLDGGLYWRAVSHLHRQHGSALIRGGAAGLLYSAGQLDDDALGEAAQGHLEGLAQPREAVAFLRGLLSVAREAAWQQPMLLSAVDAAMSRWEEPVFLALLPELRLAFADMTPKETDRIAEAVAGLHGETSLGPLVRHDVSAQAVQAHLALSATLGEVLAEDGLSDWIQP